MTNCLTGLALLPVLALGLAGAEFFEISDNSFRPFVIELKNPELIQHARDLISGQTSEKPHVLGRITKTPATYNPGWSFHLQPDSIHFFDQMVEVCDANAAYAEEHLDEAGGRFLPGNIWCPWSSKVVREIQD